MQHKDRLRSAAAPSRSTPARDRVSERFDSLAWSVLLRLGTAALRPHPET